MLATMSPVEKKRLLHDTEGTVGHSAGTLKAAPFNWDVNRGKTMSEK